jgi:hypothetical protein
MLMTNITRLSHVSDLINIIAHYEQLYYMYKQLDPSQKETLNELAIKIDTHSNNYWGDVNLHQIAQTWGNTAGGWGGIGGSAMTTTHTTVIMSYNYGTAFVYYGNTLAYIAELNESNSDLFMRKPPSLSEAKKNQKLYYYNKRK